ncbi:Probable RNA-directed DNA polymerase from transposon X-element [Eumeta japonica]|uniref:Probable RNA-directed DNA polymerase from transposon X-element n=1 Tax=Eumeta variegata TaxID=151549 RepID=A0A4C1U2G0_EUMVA|nr:Probable RNA-directed DNA polymerase from transposon X-element [Eumeta japonica]
MSNHCPTTSFDSQAKTRESRQGETKPTKTATDQNCHKRDTGFLGRNRISDGGGSRSPELSLTARNTTATSHRYFVECGILPFKPPHLRAHTSHIKTVVGSCEREVSASSDRQKFPPDILELIEQKTQLCAARALILPQNKDPERELFNAKRDNTLALDDAEVEECLADSVETQCSLTSPPHDIAHISRIEEEVLQKTSLQPKDHLTPVSLSEVQTLVKSLSTRKAPGLDGISNKAIKCFSQPLLSLLVVIFNACLINNNFIPAVKEVEVIGIHKPGKLRDLPASYRPISVLSDLAKLFERVLKTRPSDHLLGKGLIIDE